MPGPGLARARPWVELWEGLGCPWESFRRRRRPTYLPTYYLRTYLPTYYLRTYLLPTYLFNYKIC